MKTTDRNKEAENMKEDKGNREARQELHEAGEA